MERRSVLLRGGSQCSPTSRAVNVMDRTSAGSTRQGEVCRETNRDGLTVRGHGDRSKERPGHVNGGRIFTAIRDPKAIGQDASQEPVHGIGVPTRCQGEALPWQSSRHPVGSSTTDGKRGGLVGAIPEALCGKAPKGQPMIHRRHPRQVARRLSGEKPERRKTQSSQWTRIGKNEYGVALPIHCLESRLLFGRHGR